MPTTAMSDLSQQGLLDITRSLLQQNDLNGVCETLTRLVRQAGLGDRVAVLLWQPGYQRVSYHASEPHGNDRLAQEESLLAQGPMQRLLTRPDTLQCDFPEFGKAWPELAGSERYAAFGRYALLPLAQEGRIVGGCEVIRTRPVAWSDAELQRLQTLAQLVAIVTEQFQSRLNTGSDRQQLQLERDNFRILVDVTNAVLSRLDIDELVSEVAKSLHHYFHIDAISVVLQNPQPGKLDVYTSHYLDGDAPLHDISEVAKSGSLSEQVFKNQQMMLLTLADMQLAQGDRQLFSLWGNELQSICLLPLLSGDTTLGVLKLAQRDEQVFTASNLRLLRQIAERVAIAIDNALAYQEIQRLKERLADENKALTEQLNTLDNEFGEIIGRSDAMRDVLRQVEMVAQSDSTVLILGETGTGKELIARAIHNLSRRREQRMIKMNCAAMPAGLIESDLFGHSKGAFTGASAPRTGRFELADKSSLFLDEVGDMPLELQPKLLRVLQEQEFERLGSNKLIHTDVRLIAATNRDLRQMVEERLFRSDLYYRLNVFPIQLPSLRERPDDIPLLAKAFTTKIARRLGRQIDSIPARTLQTLSEMPWPGNVRELENVIERAVLLTPGNVLQLSQPEITFTTPSPTAEPRLEGEDEAQQIIRILKETNGVVAGPKGAAQRLGLKRTTLLSRMKRLGIEKDALV